MSIILKFNSKMLYPASFMVLTIFLLFVGQYVTYTTAFKTVDDLLNFFIKLYLAFDIIKKSKYK